MNENEIDANKTTSETGPPDALRFEYRMTATSGSETAFTISGMFDLPRAIVEPASSGYTGGRFQKVFDETVRSGVFTAANYYIRRRIMQLEAQAAENSPVQELQADEVTQSFSNLGISIDQLVGAGDVLRKAA